MTSRQRRPLSGERGLGSPATVRAVAFRYWTMIPADHCSSCKICCCDALVTHLVFITGTRDRHHSRDNKLGFKRSVKLRVPALNRKAYEPANSTVTVFGAAMLKKTDFFFDPQGTAVKYRQKRIQMIDYHRAETEW